MTWPFKPGDPPKINLKDLETANKISYQQTSVVNRRRAAGVEPTKVNLPGSRDEQPARFAVKMPDMPKHDRTLRRNKGGKT
jgi:hypothetical protein